MRLWTLHPKYLDAQGLVAVWREGLLAQAVLRGRTRGYRSHPQLHRFRAHPRPLAAIAVYLSAICDEADLRGYEFDRRKVARTRGKVQLRETYGQLRYEWEHLRRKLQARSPERFQLVAGVHKPHSHPMFRLISGSIQDWERVAPAAVRPKGQPKKPRTRLKTR